MHISSLASKTAAAPSLILLALAAVIVPEPSVKNTGFNLDTLNSQKSFMYFFLQLQAYHMQKRSLKQKQATVFQII